MLQAPLDPRFFFFSERLGQVRGSNVNSRKPERVLLEVFVAFKLASCILKLFGRKKLFQHLLQRTSECPCTDKNHQSGHAKQTCLRSARNVPGCMALACPS